MVRHADHSSLTLGSGSSTTRLTQGIGRSQRTLRQLTANTGHTIHVHYPGNRQPNPPLILHLITQTSCLRRFEAGKVRRFHYPGFLGERSIVSSSGWDPCAGPAQTEAQMQTHAPVDTELSVLSSLALQ